MTQKSVSIKANVSIRGVTIRAYALYLKYLQLQNSRVVIPSMAFSNNQYISNTVPDALTLR